MVRKDGASCLCRFSKSGLNGGDNTNSVLLQNTDTTSVIMISIDRFWLFKRNRNIGVFAGRGGERWDRYWRNKKPPTRFPAEARFPRPLAPVLGAGDAFEYDVYALEADGFQDPVIHVKRLHILVLNWLQRSGDCEDGTPMDGDGRP